MNNKKTLTLVFATPAGEEVRVTSTKPQQMLGGAEIKLAGDAAAASGALAYTNDKGVQTVCNTFVRAYHTMVSYESIELDA